MTIHHTDSDQVPSGATAGDTLLRRQGDDVAIARVTEGGAEWLGSVPASTLPLDGDDAALQIAVKGVESALVERGG